MQDVNIFQLNNQNYSKDLQKEDYDKISSIYLNFNISTNDLNISFSTLNHPITYVNYLWMKNILSVNDEYYSKNKEVIKNLIISICKETKSDNFTIVDSEFIDKDVIIAIATNPNIREVTLGNSKNPYLLTQSDYEIFKSSKKESVITIGVSNEISTIFDDMIAYNKNKFILDTYTYNNINSNNELRFNNFNYEQLKYLKYIGNNISKIFFNLEKIDFNLFLDMIAELNKAGYNGEKIINKEINKNKLNEFIFNHVDELYNANIYIEVDWFKTVNLLDYVKYEKKLLKMIEPAKNLSPFEKYLYAYNKVKSFKKYRENNDNMMESRNLYDVLEGDYIVCVGFSKLLNDLLTKLGIPSSEFSFDVDVGLDKVPNNFDPLNNNIRCSKVGHSRLLVNLEDPKYNINGYYISDSTWDNNMKLDYYNHALMTADEVNSLNRYNYYDIRTIKEIFFCNTLEEFYYKVNFYLDRSSKVMKKNYHDFFGEVYTLFQKVDKNLIDNLENKFGKLNDNSRKFSNKEISDIMLFLGNYVIHKTNNVIDGQTFKNGITKLYRDVYHDKNYQQTVNKIMDYNRISQSRNFPLRYKKNNTKEIVINNAVNKFDLVSDNVNKKR